MKVFVFGLRGFPNIQGGVEKHCEALYNSFGNKDIEFYICRRKPYICETPSYEHIHFIDLPSTKIKGLEAALHSLIATIYALFYKIDVIHIHNIGPALYIPLLCLFGKKVVVTYHSPNYEHKKWGLFAKRVLKFSESITFYFASHIIFVNKFQQSRTPDRYICKTSCIPNGIDKSISCSDGVNEVERLCLKPRKYILAVGRITPEKGFDILAEAVNNMQDKSFKLCIAGAVETETSYLTTIKTLIDPERIVFTGFVTGETLRQLYSHAFLYVLSSRNEGFPLCLLDAMAYKKNILASDIPAAHLVKLPQENYYPVEDKKELSRKITAICSCPMQQVSYDITEYDWDVISGQVYDIYTELAKK